MRDITKECKRRIKKVLKSKLIGMNIIKGIYTWAMPILRYSATILKWARVE